MNIHREGKNIILITLSILILINTCISFFVPLFYSGLAIFVSFIILFFLLQFFRNPKRIISDSTDIINSPADGKIVFVDKEFEKEFFNKELTKVSIFMSVTSVHLNRVPVSGKVIYTKYHPGKYLVAFNPKSSELNERNTVVIEDTNKNQILVRQIAGAVARRIKPYLHKNDIVTIGDELGFIKFGSRVDLFIPNNVKLNVKPGDKVNANRSIIAFFQ